jgi:hypothetical protein
MQCNDAGIGCDLLVVPENRGMRGRGGMVYLQKGNAGNAARRFSSRRNLHLQMTTADLRSQCGDGG